MKPSFPKKLSREFLLVDLVNNLGRLAERRDYGSVRTRKFFTQALAAGMAPHAG
jgi:hypothetical protein